jgi:hypothetical protein
MDGRGVGVRFSAKTGDFSLLHNVRTGLLYDGYRGLLFRVKAEGE